MNACWALLVGLTIAFGCSSPNNDDQPFATAGSGGGVHRAGAAGASEIGAGGAGDAGAPDQGGTAGASAPGGSGGGAGAPTTAVARSAARIVAGGTLMRSSHFRLIASMPSGVGEGTSSASAHYELHGGVVAGKN